MFVTKLCKLMLVVAIAVSVAIPVYAAVYDAAADFSTTTNPLGPWTYGQTWVGGEGYFGDPVFGPLYNTYADGQWNQDGLYNKGGFISKNLGSSWGSDPYYVEPGQLAFGPSGWDLGRAAVMRWTAPNAAKIKIDYTFRGASTNGTTTDVYVRNHIGYNYFSGVINGFGGAPGIPASGTGSFSGSAMANVVAGDKIYFEVGCGTPLNNSNDTTGVKAVITEVTPLTYTWDAARDLSTTTNPFGPWAYGQTWVGGEGWFGDPSYGPLYNTYGGTDVPTGWCSNNRYNEGGFITKNTAASWSMGGPFYCEPGQLFFYPSGWDISRAAVMRWTAPYSSEIRIDYSFLGCSENGTTTDVHIRSQAGYDYFVGTISGFSGAPGKSPSGTGYLFGSVSLSVAAGDNIYFEVGSGGNGNSNDQTGVNIGIMAIPPFSGSIDQLKTKNDGAGVQTSVPVVVTAPLDGYFYVESEDRSSGIAVIKANHGMMIGQKVTLVGKMGTGGNGERYIDNPDITPAGIGSIEPLAITCKNLGGGPAPGQLGVADGVGLNNIGMLVTVSGRVSIIEGDDFGFNVTDGSGRVVKCIVPAGEGYPYWTHTYATVTGVCIRQIVGDVAVPAVMLRQPSDLVGAQ